MNGKYLKESLRSSRRVYGTLAVSTSPMWPKVVQRMGLDYIFIDTEHIPMGRETLSWMCQAYQAMSIAPLVRIPMPDPYQASMALDGGAAGIIIPYIESAKQVRSMVGAVKYKPIKGDKLDAFLEKGVAFEEELSTYIEKGSEDRLLIVNIESIPGIQALPEILKIKELDAVLIGPHDLTASLGIPEEYTHPKFIDAVEGIIKATRKAEKGVGIHMVYDNALDQEIDWVKMGANLVLHGADLIAFKREVFDSLSNIKKALGDDQEDSTENLNI